MNCYLCEKDKKGVNIDYWDDNGYHTIGMCCGFDIPEGL